MKGPIGHFDAACGSSTAALNEAFIALKSGICDRALVAGFNICLLPAITQQFCDLQMVSPSGRSKALDKSADGYGRSEAVCCVLLQLKPEAKRVYSTIVNCRSNADGYKEQGITFPSVFLQRQLMAETYDEVGIDPNEIEYVESHTTGTQVGDPVELMAIYDFFCHQRSSDNPLKIGCLKSNMGHSEAASGLCAVIKANIIFQSGHIPGNLHYKNPNPRIEGLMDGKMVPVLERILFSCDYISLNCFGFGGANVHLILKGFKETSKPDNHNIVTQIPRLVPICSRTYEGVKRIQTFLKDNESSLTNEFFDLLNQYSKASSMPYKGYTLISRENGGLSFHNHTENRKFEQDMRTVLILPADQAKFDTAFMHLPVFSDTLDRLSQHIKSLDVDLAQLILGELRPNTIREKIVTTFASQLLIYHLMRAINVPIDEFTGNWIGNFTHAVARNLISERRAIVAAYWIGHSIDSEGVPSTPIDTASHKESCEIDLNNKNTRTGIVYIERNMESSTFEANCFMETGGIDSSTNPSFIETLSTFNDDYTLNSGKSVPVKNGKSIPFSMNLQRLQHIDAKFSHKKPINLDSGILIDCSSGKPLNHENYVELMNSDTLRIDRFLESIGQLYTLNIPINISCLYPRVDYPVPIDTPSLHSLIDFDHTKSYKVFKYPDHLNPYAPRSSFSVKISLSNPEDQFFSGHKIDGRVLLPATGTLMYVWKAAAWVHRIDIRRSKFLFRDVSFIRAINLTADEVCLKVSYMSHDGSFSVAENDSPVVTGKIFPLENIDEAKTNFISSKTDTHELESNEVSLLDLTREDIYKELKNRGYDYGPDFRCLTKADQCGRNGYIEWKEVSSLTFKSGSILERIHDEDFTFLKTWATFCDSMMQFAILSDRGDRGLFLPTAIESILIDAEQLLQRVNLLKELSIQTDGQPAVVNNQINFTVSLDSITRTVLSESVWIRGLKTTLVSRRPQKVTIEAQEFIPFNEEDMVDSKIRNQLIKYNQLCEKYVAAIKSDKSNQQSSARSEAISKLSNVGGDFPYEKDDSFSFLGLLIDTLDKSLAGLEAEKIDQDILIGRELQYCSSERFLRPFITTVLNTYSYCGQLNTSLNIIEYNSGRNFLLEPVKTIVDALSIGTAELTYKIACPEKSSEAGESVKKKSAFCQLGC